MQRVRLKFRSLSIGGLFTHAPNVKGLFMKKFLFLFLLFPHFAFASFTSSGGYTITRGADVLLQSTSAESVLAACILVQGDPMHNVMAVLGFVPTYTNLNSPTQCAWSGVGGSSTSSSVIFSSCPNHATGSGGTCTCDSGYSQTTTTPTACYIRAASPHGATAPVGPLGAFPLGIAGAVALGVLGVAGAILGAPLVGVAALGSAALASGLLAAPAFYGGSGAANTAVQEFAQAGSPLSVSLAPSDTYSAGSSGSPGAVGVSTAGTFVPAGGGTFSGTGASGGWAPTTGGASGEWTYSQPVSGAAAVPIAAITNNGYTYEAITSVSGGSTSGAVSGALYSDGSLTVTDARTVPVITSGGSVTTAEVAVVNSFGSDGARLPGGSFPTIGPTLGDGTASNGGSGLAMVGAGSGGGGGGTGAGTGGPTKIDETGTPSAVPFDYYKSLAIVWRDQANSNLNVVSEYGDKGFLSGWNVFFAAPAVVACSPFVLPRNMGSIDPCPVVDGVRTVMGYLWALGGLWLCIGMVRKTL